MLDECLSLLLCVSLCSLCFSRSLPLFFLASLSVHFWFSLSQLSLSLCGQTLNIDGLLSVWFNDEDCPAYVRDTYFLNR